MKKRGTIALVVFILAFMLFSVLADTNTLISCLSNADCQDLNGGSYYCNADTQTCYVLSEETPAQSTSSTIEERVSHLETKVDALQDISTKTSSALNLLTTEVQHLNRQLEKLLQTIKPGAQKTGEESAFPAVLEQSAEAKKTLAGKAVADEEQEGFSSLTIFLFFLLILVIAAGIVFFITRKKENPQPLQELQKAEKEAIHYITAHLKAGKKFFHIKENLQKVGWHEPEIKRLYKLAVQTNYQKYKEKKKEKNPPAVSEKQRILIIAVVAILLVGGVFLFLQQIVGKAISTEQLVGGEKGGYAGEVTYKVECTPPQIPTPEGESCCTDANQDTVCDVAEKEVEKTTEKCTDNLQCPAGEYCIDGTCGLLSSVYHGSPNCEKMCNYYSLKISTSDGEAYTVKPGRGSYTAVGAVQWDVLKGVPSHCEGERAKIPLLISKREPGKITDEYVLTLRQGETSGPITHRLVPGLEFSLTLGQVYELCEEI